jgi:hypothetical protein
MIFGIFNISSFSWKWLKGSSSIDDLRIYESIGVLGQDLDQHYGLTPKEMFIFSEVLVMSHYF